MTDKLREATQQALDDELLTGQALHLIGALMSRGFLPNTLSSAEHTTLWDVVKRHLRCVNKEGARAALAQQDEQAVEPLTDAQKDELMAITGGMTLRQYAAIKLRVPNSGTDWLDEMIVQSLRDEFAAKAMQGLLAAWIHGVPDDKTITAAAYKYADAMQEKQS